MEVDEDDIEQPSSSDNKATKKRFEVKKVKCQCRNHQKNSKLSVIFSINFSTSEFH